MNRGFHSIIAISPAALASFFVMFYNRKEKETSFHEF